MPRSWASWLSACVVLLVCAPQAAGAQATTRVFAMQPKLDLGWMESRATYHDKVFALADRSLRGAGAPVVQRTADDVVSHLRPDGRNLVVWPEDIGLWAAFTGRRGDAARGSGSLEGAVAALLADYSPQAGYYGQKYPAVAARAPQVRLLALSLTDTFGRTAVETFSEMAAKHHVWLEAGVDMAQSWHVVCVNGAHPPQEACDEENPAKVQQLGDPFEPGRGYAYEATSPDVSNMALVFDPSGRLVSKQVKEYITPIELGQDEGQVAALDLVPGRVTGGLTPVRTPVGTLGFVTSKDAWMPDVVDKLEEGGADILVQPEFFVGDVVSKTGMWAPDTLKASGYNDLLRHPGFNAMVLPSAVGNVFDFTADAQSQIAVRPRSGRGGAHLLGQDPAAGLAAVTPFVVDDPVGAPFPERRSRLADAGAKLAPGSGVKCPDPAEPGACENGHVETVLWRDVPVGPRPYRHARAKRVRTAFGRSRPLARSRRPQRNPALALSGRFGALVFEERRAGRDQVVVLTSRDGGKTWSGPRHPTGRRAGSTDERWPAVAVDARGRITLAWGDDSSGTPRVWFARSAPRGGRFGFPVALDGTSLKDAQWKPALAAGAGGVVHAAFVDERARSPQGGLPQAGIYYTRIAPDGAPAKAERMDQGPPAALAAKLDNAWAPALAAKGDQVLLTWIDFMHYDWDVLSRLSTDGGAKFADQVLVTKQAPEVETLSDSPRPFFTGAGPRIAWTDWHKRDTPDQLHPQYDTFLAAPGRDGVQVDPFGERPASTFWPAPCSAGRDAFVAWQDGSAGVARVRVTRVGGRGRAKPWRMNDSGANASRPAIACSKARVLAVWEDDRDGPSQIYSAAAAARRLR